MTPDDPRHGTPRGYDAHRRDDETACPPCRKARARYEQERLLDRMRGTPRRVPAIGSARRIQALVALGYSFTAIAAEAGVGHDMPTKWAKLKGSITSRNARLIADVYERLNMSFPACETRAQRSEATYARTMARRYGWVPPLAWDTIDDPNETPADSYQPRRRAQAPGGAFLPPVYEEPDEQVVFRILSGDWRLPCTVWEKREVVAQWNGTQGELEFLTGWKVDRYIDREEASA